MARKKTRESESVELVLVKPTPPRFHGVVRYTGKADARKITAADLASMGVIEAKSDLLWDGSNGRVLDIDDERTFNALIKLPHFEVA